MTSKQEHLLMKVREEISVLRSMLDHLMYYSEPLKPEEHKKVRQCYDKVCEAADQI